MDMEVEEANELMRRYSRGEDHVFERLYALIAPALHRFCGRLAGRRADSDDLFQESFLKLHRARSSYLPGANVLHWAFAIARSTYIDRLRYRRRRPEELGAARDVAEDEHLSGDGSPSPEAHAQADDLAEVVTLELRRMSEKIRSAYVLLREENLTVKEAAAVLGTTTDVVKQRAHRAYQQLRNAIAAADGASADPKEHLTDSRTALARERKRPPIDIENAPLEQLGAD
jgi:RNA polymerase sigma-70 factor (ECF subfamily)